MYSRLLASDAAAAVLAAAPPPPDAASADAAVADALFAEFDTLSVLARAPAATFVVGGGTNHPNDAHADPHALATPTSPAPVDGGLLLVDDILGAGEASALLAELELGGDDATRPASAAAASDPFGMLAGGGPSQPTGLDPLADLLGGGGGGGGSTAPASTTAVYDPFGLGDLLAAAPK